MNQVALSDLDGTSWRLVDFNGGQDPALPEPVMTLQIGDGQVSGFAGCNDYAAPVTGQEDVAQSFIVGPITTTEQLCPELAANQEASYLTRLGRGWCGCTMRVTWRSRTSRTTTASRTCCLSRSQPKRRLRQPGRRS